MIKLTIFLLYFAYCVNIILMLQNPRIETTAYRAYASLIVLLCSGFVMMGAMIVVSSLMMQLILLSTILKLAGIYLAGESLKRMKITR